MRRFLLWLLIAGAAPLQLALMAAAQSPAVPVGKFSPTREPVSPDGTRATVDLPVGQHMRNVGGSDGAGLCVFTSVEHSARWQNVRDLDGLQKWMTRRPGGGWPEKLDQVLAAFCRERGLPVPVYIQHTGGDETFLELALHTDRLPCVTYSGLDDFYRDRLGRPARIAHMVNLAYLDQLSAAIIDNNRPGQWVWMTRAEFLARWRDMDGGWAVVLLAPPPPPHPGGAGGACICGDDCKCQPGECPAKCPVSVGQCVDGKCNAPPSPPPIGQPPSPRHVWREIPGWGWGWDLLPEPVAPAGVGAAENFGVNSKKIHDHPEYSIGGSACSAAIAQAALRGGTPLADDSDRWHLTAVGDAAFRDLVRAHVGQLPREVRDRILFQAYDPADWPVQAFRLPPGVSLRKPSPVRTSAEVGAIAVESYTVDRLATLLAAPGGPRPPPVPVPAQPKSPDAKPVEPVPPSDAKLSGILVLLLAGLGAVWAIFRNAK